MGTDKDFTYVYNDYPSQLTIHGEDFETTLYYSRLNDSSNNSISKKNNNNLNDGYEK